MDTSFTFVTALTPATGKIKGAPKFSKLSADKLRENKLKTTRNATSYQGVNRKTYNQRKITIDESTNSSLITNDSTPSLKSCSESLHFSSDRSLSDREEKKVTSIPGPSNQSRLSESKTTFKKIIQEVHAGLEKITFRKKRAPKAKTNVDYYDCLEQMTAIKINDKTQTQHVKSSTPTNNCDKIPDEKISHDVEELNNLEDEMLNLSLEKVQTTHSVKFKHKPINKKLFNSLSNEQNDSVRNVEKPPFLMDDSSGIISEDISPILRVSVVPSNNKYLDNDDFLSRENHLLNEDTKGSNNSIKIHDNLDSKAIIKKETKSNVETTKAKDKKRNKVLSELNCEEERKDEKEEIKKKGKSKENAVRTKVKKTKKKKDSFIVSDASSVDNESFSLYHKFISENIKFDVIKTTTPRSKFKKHSEFPDDGIFTPYIIKGKRSSSDDSFSEGEDDYKETRNPKKFRVSSDEENPLSDAKKSISSSLSSLSASEENDLCSINRKLPKEVVKKNLKNIQPKKTIKAKRFNRIKTFSDSDSSAESPSKVLIDLTSSPSFTPGSSLKEKKKITPITFKLKNLKKLTPTRTPDVRKEPLSFLRSLSTLTSPHMVHPEAQPYRKSFKKLKQQLAQKLFVLFNKEVFDNKLPEDLKIEWNARMRSSSGLCYNRRVKTVIGPNKECLRVSRIALSTKIIESPERLRDTLIHELCHAAAWIIDNKADGHGPCWKSWANKALRRFPELPAIKRCHDYAVQTKFKYKCVSCGYTIGRHSKSLNLDRKRCGYCYGRFELIINNENLKGGVSATSPRNVKVRPLSKFALFVKENYGKIKTEHSHLKHGEVMKVLSQNFAETKTS